MAEAQNYETIQEHNKEWDEKAPSVFPKVYGSISLLDHPTMQFAFNGISSQKTQALLKMENLFNYTQGCSYMEYKIGRFTFGKDCSEKKIARKRLIDDNTISRVYAFRTTTYKIINEETQEVLQYGNKAYYLKDGEYGFDHPLGKIDINLQLLESLVQTEEVKQAMLKKIDDIIQYFDTYCRYEFRGLSVLLIVSHTQKLYDAKMIDLEYMYELPEGEKDKDMLRGLRNVKNMLNHLFTGASLPEESTWHFEDTTV